MLMCNMKNSSGTVRKQNKTEYLGKRVCGVCVCARCAK